MITDYLQNCLPHINKVLSQQHEAEQVVERMVKTIRDDGIIFAFGTGHSHMIPMEMFGRAGGLANVCAMLDETVLNGGGARRSSRMEKLPGLADVIWQSTPPGPQDMLFIVSNSGRNAAVVEMALKAREEGVFSVAITSMVGSREMAWVTTCRTSAESSTIMTLIFFCMMQLLASSSSLVRFTLACCSRADRSSGAAARVRR